MHKEAVVRLPDGDMFLPRTDSSASKTGSMSDNNDRERHNYASSLLLGASKNRQQEISNHQREKMQLQSPDASAAAAFPSTTQRRVTISHSSSPLLAAVHNNLLLGQKHERASSNHTDNIPLAEGQLLSARNIAEMESQRPSGKNSRRGGGRCNLAQQHAWAGLDSVKNNSAAGIVSNATLPAEKSNLRSGLLKRWPPEEGIKQNKNTVWWGTSAAMKCLLSNQKGKSSNMPLLNALKIDIERNRKQQCQYQDYQQQQMMRMQDQRHQIVHRRFFCPNNETINRNIPIVNIFSVAQQAPERLTCINATGNSSFEALGNYHPSIGIEARTKSCTALSPSSACSPSELSGESLQVRALKSPPKAAEKTPVAVGGSSGMDKAAGKKKIWKLTSKDTMRKCLLHVTCQFEPTNFEAVEKALKRDPMGIRRRLQPKQLEGLIACVLDTKKNQGTASYPQQESNTERSRAKSLSLIRKVSCSYSLAMNIAIKNGASAKVLEILIQAEPSVLKEKDGPSQETALHIALKSSSANKPFSEETVQKMLHACPEAASVIDRHDNTVLHAACRHRPKYADVIKLLLKIFPDAASRRNFHGDTPLQVLQLSGAVADDEVVSILQKASAAILSSQR